jgi:hypothetical protein
MKSKITIRLYLQYPNIQKKLSPILISVSWSGERVFKSTGVSVFPGDWDKRKADINICILIGESTVTNSKKLQTTINATPIGF